MKIALLFAVALLLSGCNDGKLNNAFFVGDWDCDGAEYSSRTEDSFLITDKDKSKKNNILIKIKLEDNQLYAKQKNEEDWNEFNVAETNIEDKSHGSNNLKITEINSVVKNSDNQFTRTSENKLVNIENGNSFSLIHELECKRL